MLQSPFAFTQKTNWRIYKRKTQVVCAALGTIALSTSTALAAPTGGQITGGTGAINVSGKATNINQNSDRLDIRWNSFGSKADESINFTQPSVTATAINRVTGGVPSQLDGALKANGRVYILNDSGVAFGKSATVNVGSLVATTAKDVSINGDVHTFTGDGDGKVVNAGTITVSNGGFALLAAPQVGNQGTIQANLGKVALASANTYTVDLRGDQLITYSVTKDVTKKLKDIPYINNTGSIQAKSGTVTLTASLADNIVKGVINLGGMVDASAFAPNGNGGTVLVNSATGLNTTATINADGQGTGNGGKVITDALINNFDNTASISVKGGDTSGNGGTAKIAGVLYRAAGKVDTSAANGHGGTVTIATHTVDLGDLTSEAANADTLSGKAGKAEQVLKDVLAKVNTLTVENAAGSKLGINAVSEQFLEGQSQHGGNVVLKGKTLRIDNLADNQIHGGAGSITLANTGKSGQALAGGSITFADKDDAITTTTGDITLNGSSGGIDAGNLKTGTTTTYNPGKIKVTTQNGGAINLNNLAIEADGGLARLVVKSDDTLKIDGNVTISNNDQLKEAVMADSYAGLVSVDDMLVKGDINILSYDHEGTTNQAYATLYIRGKGTGSKCPFVGSDPMQVSGKISVIADASKNLGGSDFLCLADNCDTGVPVIAQANLDLHGDDAVKLGDVNVQSFAYSNGMSTVSATTNAGIYSRAILGTLNLGNLNFTSSAISDTLGDAKEVTAQTNANVEASKSITVNGTTNSTSYARGVGDAMDDLTIQFLSTLDAFFRNSFGIYYTDAQGNPVNGEIAFRNLKTTPAGETMTYKLKDVGKAGLFLLPDAPRSQTITDGEKVTFKQEDGVWYAYAPDGSKILGRTALDETVPEKVGAYFSDSKLNPDGSNHVVDNNVEGNSNWEDLYKPYSDEDYNDGNFNVTRTEHADVNVKATSNLTMKVLNQDFVLNSPVNNSAVAENGGNGSTAIANARTDLLAGKNLMVTNGVQTTAEGSSKADAYTNAEAGLRASGSATFGSYLKASAKTTADASPANATVRVARTPGTAIAFTGDAPQADADDATIQQTTSGVATDAEDKAELILDGVTTATKGVPCECTTDTVQTQDQLEAYVLANRQ